MAKNADDKGPAGAGGGKSRADQVRAAVEGAFGATAQGAAPVQKRAQELADELVSVAARVRETLVSGDELAGAASRVRGALEELRPPSPEELETLRAQVDALERRVAELEAAAAAKPKRRAPAKPKSKPKRS
jgi:polyhydroxyalkanoate synthesis regulator phasin